MYFQIYKPEKSHHLQVLDRIWKRFWIPNGKWLWFQVVPILGLDAIFEYMVVDWNQKLSRIYYRFFLHQNMDLFSLVQSLLEALQKNMYKIVYQSSKIIGYKNSILFNLAEIPVFHVLIPLILRNDTNLM